MKLDNKWFSVVSSVGIVVLVVSTVIALSPGFKSRLLIDRYARIAERVEALERNLAVAQQLWGEGPGSLEDVLETVEGRIGGVVDLLASVSESQSAIVARLADIEKRVAELARENLQRQAPDTGGAYGDVMRLFAERTTDILDLPEELASTARHLSAAGIAQLVGQSKEKAIERLIEVGALEFPSCDEIPPDALDHLVQLLELHRATVDLLSFRQDLQIRAAQERAAESGDFVTVAFGEAGLLQRAQLRLQEERGDGVLSTIRGDGGYRVFHLSYKDYPRIAEFFTLADNTVKHLVRDLELLGEQYRE